MRYDNMNFDNGKGRHEFFMGFLSTMAECGQDMFDTGLKPWYMYIINMDTEKVLCSGIIITTNLLATSHECLQLPERRYYVFDAWFSETGSTNMYDIVDLGIAHYPEARSALFKIVNIIYNYRYGVNVATSSHPRNNLALIQVTPEFTAYDFLSPICIPEREDDLRDLLGQEAYHYGLHQKDSSQEDECDMDPGLLEPLPFSISGIVVEDGQCSHESHKKNDQLLCFKRIRLGQPRFGEGALFYKSKSIEIRNFLVGISAVKPTVGDGGSKLINFSKISGKYTLTILTE